MTAFSLAAAPRARSGQDASPARVSLVAPADLTSAQVAAWRRFQACDPDLDSPFLTPEYVRIAAAVRPRVQVAVAEAEGRPVGFFPFERRRGGVGKPVGGPLSDCQAVVADPAWDWDPRGLVAAAGLSVFDFTHLRATQRGFAPHHRAAAPSHAIDLSRGFDEYMRERRAAAAGQDHGSGRPHHAAARLRKLEKHAGRVEFAFHDPDPRALRLLLEWKGRHYRRTGVPDAFAHAWCVDLVERIHAHRNGHLDGALSTLSAGGRIVALHFGMRTPGVLHWWFPSYDPAFSRFSPGLILLVELCRHACGLGVRGVELGAGDEPYKQLVANAAIPEASGFVGAPSPATWLRGLGHGAVAAAARLPLGPLSRWPAKAALRIDQMTRYR